MIPNLRQCGGVGVLDNPEKDANIVSGAAKTSPQPPTAAEAFYLGWQQSLNQLPQLVQPAISDGALFL